jgi:transposase-like protein
LGRPYHTIERRDTQALAAFWAQHGQAFLPTVELMEQSKLLEICAFDISQAAVDELIDVLGRSSIEAVLRLSAEGAAGPPHPGKKGGAVGWHGGEMTTVALAERKLRVRRPRLRKKQSGKEGEVPVPAYEAMRRDGKLRSRLLEILLRGVSTRQYNRVLPEMASAVGMSKSSVSAEAIKASGEELRKLCERRWDQVELVVIYLDGIVCGKHHVLAALGVDVQGTKHVLGIAEGASDNQVVAQGLLEQLIERGVDPRRKRLFVIDGSKVLRAAIDAVFGAVGPVQRYRYHKIMKVMASLHEHLKAQVKAAIHVASSLASGARKRSWAAIALLWEREQWTVPAHSLFRDVFQSGARLPRRTLFSSALLHFVVALFLVRMPYLLLTQAATGEVSKRRNEGIIYYNLKKIRLAQLFPNVTPSGPRGKSGRGIHSEHPPVLGSSATHPQMTIVLNLPRPDNNRQTILQLPSPPDLRIPEELRVPDVLPGNPSAPAKPRFEFHATAAEAKQTKPKNVQIPEPPKIPLASAELTLLETIVNNSKPRLPLPPPSSPLAPKEESGQAAGNRGLYGGEDGPGDSAGIFSISVDPANTSQLALPPGNRFGSFTISPVGPQPGSPGGTTTGDPLGGRGGAGSGGDGIGTGDGGGEGRGAGTNTVLSIAGGARGGNGPNNQALVLAFSPESLVYAVPPTTRMRSPALVISAGPTGGGGLQAYGALRGGKIYTVYLGMSGRPWILQYCEVPNPTSPPPSQSRVIQIEPPLVPPEPKEKFDFHRLLVPIDKKNALIVLRGIIREDGSVDHLSVFQGIDSEMDRTALVAFGKWKFTPASRGGKPVAIEILIGIPANGVGAK